jgi:hypothetical protein
MPVLVPVMRVTLPLMTPFPVLIGRSRRIGRIVRRRRRQDNGAGREEGDTLVLQSGRSPPREGT